MILPTVLCYAWPAVALVALRHHHHHHLPGRSSFMDSGTAVAALAPTTNWRHQQSPRQKWRLSKVLWTARQGIYDGGSVASLNGRSVAATNGLAMSSADLVVDAEADVGVASAPSASAPARESFSTQDQQQQPEPHRARSVFGTKEYWDEMYQGRGDFPSDEYCWYYGWDTIKRHAQPYLRKDDRLLLPGIGNDPMLLDLVQSNYRHITVQDYSVHALQRQKDLLEHYLSDKEALASVVTMVPGDVRHLPAEWDGRYDAVVEKGLLDAVYLSGDGNVELAVASLFRALRPGGIFVSVSGVVPDALRRELFRDAKWLRDGSHDLQAGCFVFQKPTS